MLARVLRAAQPTPVADLQPSAIDQDGQVHRPYLESREQHPTPSHALLEARTFVGGTEMLPTVDAARCPPSRCGGPSAATRISSSPSVAEATADSASDRKNIDTGRLGLEEQVRIRLAQELVSSRISSSSLT